MACILSIVGNLLSRRNKLAALIAALVLCGPAKSTPGPGRLRAAPGRPHIVVITVDTLRADRVSAYGYGRQTTPNIDRLIAAGARFSGARTVEPLTSPALCSMLLSAHPHEHGASRNGLRMRPGLDSLPKQLAAAGYETAAFVSNWTLRDKLSGLAEHFDVYEEVLTKRRWFGLLRAEANAHDITAAALDWLRHGSERADGAPLFLWAHYSEPHAPYKMHDEFRRRLGLPRGSDVTAADRYDTEIAFVDRSIGLLLDTVEQKLPADNTIVVFASDHGESLGEHGYWGHGRNLFEPNLRIPMSLTWKGRVAPAVIAEPAVNLDLAPTLMRLAGLPAPAAFRGYDWGPVLAGHAAAPARTTQHQTHRGAVISRHDSDLARRAGLLEVGLVRDEMKEIFRVERQKRRRYDLATDPGELEDTAGERSDPSEELQSWLRDVYTGLTSFDDVPPDYLDPESVEQLRSLGYVE